jgi:hypothetical protein
MILSRFTIRTNHVNSIINIASSNLLNNNIVAISNIPPLNGLTWSIDSLVTGGINNNPTLTTLSTQFINQMWEMRVRLNDLEPGQTFNLKIQVGNGSSSATDTTLIQVVTTLPTPTVSVLTITSVTNLTGDNYSYLFTSNFTFTSLYSQVRLIGSTSWSTPILFGSIISPQTRVVSLGGSFETRIYANDITGTTIYSNIISTTLNVVVDSINIISRNVIPGDGKSTFGSWEFFISESNAQLIYDNHLNLRITTSLGDKYPSLLLSPYSQIYSGLTSDPFNSSFWNVLIDGFNSKVSFITSIDPVFSDINSWTNFVIIP